MIAVIINFRKCIKTHYSIGPVLLAKQEKKHPIISCMPSP